jgi:hypothetical protein
VESKANEQHMHEEVMWFFTLEHVSYTLQHLPRIKEGFASYKTPSTKDLKPQ